MPAASRTPSDDNWVRRLAAYRLSPLAFRRVSLFAVWSLGFIIVTGAAVRLTGSGLGCTDWPACTHNDLVSPWQYHALVEFGNRIVTGVVSVVLLAAVPLSALRRPRRSDLTWLSWGLFAGLPAEIVLGGEVVRHNLDPPYVMAHFLFSLVLLALGVALYHRSGFEDGPLDGRGRARRPGTPSPLVSRAQLILGRLLPPAAGVVIFLGTIVTSTGPHGGAPTAPRFHLSLHDVAKLHSSAVWGFLGLSVFTLWRMYRSGAPAEVMRRGETLMVVLVCQGAVGYLQYFSGVPAWLVEIHVTLAATLWVFVLLFALGLTTRPVLVAPANVASRPVADPVDTLLAPA